MSSKSHHTAHCTLHTAHCTLHPAHFTLHTAHALFREAHTLVPLCQQAEVDDLFERRREMELTYMETKQKRQEQYQAEIEALLTRDGEEHTKLKIKLETDIQVRLRAYVSCRGGGMNPIASARRPLFIWPPSKPKAMDRSPQRSVHFVFGLPQAQKPRTNPIASAQRPLRWLSSNLLKLFCYINSSRCTFSSLSASSRASLCALPLSAP